MNKIVRAQKLRAVRVVAAAVRQDTKVLLSLRAAQAEQGGLWEFPGGKLEPRERSVSGLARELDEELGIRIQAATPLIRVRHRYSEKLVDLAVFDVRDWSGQPHGREGQRVEWAMLEELTARAFPAANLPIITAVKLPRLAMITPDLGADEAAFLIQLERCVAAGVELVQLRIRLTGDDFMRVARAATSICERFGTRLLLNGSVADCVASGAHGVHLNAARLFQCHSRPLPADQWVSASVHNLSELRQAQRIGVDFAYIAPVHATSSHPGAAVLGWEALQRLVRCAQIPVYALGGMAVDDMGTAVRAGCQGIAMLSALWQSSAPAEMLAACQRATAKASYRIAI